MSRVVAEGGVDFGEKDTALRLAQTMFIHAIPDGTPAIEAVAAAFTAGVHLGLLVGREPTAKEWLDWFEGWSPAGKTFAAMLRAMVP